MDPDTQLLYQLLAEVQLERFFLKIRDELNVTRIEHLDYVKDTDLEQIGIRKPGFYLLYSVLLLQHYYLYFFVSFLNNWCCVNRAKTIMGSNQALQNQHAATVMDGQGKGLNLCPIFSTIVSWNLFRQPLNHPLTGLYWPWTRRRWPVGWWCAWPRARCSTSSYLPHPGQRSGVWWQTGLRLLWSGEEGRVACTYWTSGGFVCSCWKLFYIQLLI